MNQNQRDADMSLAETWAPLDGCVLCVLQPRGQLFMDRTRLCCLLPAGARPTTMKWALATRGSPPLGTWGPKTLGWGGDQHSEQRREAQEAVWLSAAHRDTASTGLGVRCTRGSASPATRR